MPNSMNSNTVSHRLLFALMSHADELKRSEIWSYGLLWATKWAGRVLYERRSVMIELLPWMPKPFHVQFTFLALVY